MGQDGKCPEMGPSLRVGKTKRLNKSMLGITGRFGIIISMGNYISKLSASPLSVQKATHDSIVTALASVNFAVRNFQVRLAVGSLKK